MGYGLALFRSSQYRKTAKKTVRKRRETGCLGFVVIAGKRYGNGYREQAAGF
jgi:hypothetical protein